MKRKLEYAVLVLFLVCLTGVAAQVYTDLYKQDSLCGADHEH